jgi:hypothetical protein
MVPFLLAGGRRSAVVFQHGDLQSSSGITPGAACAINHAATVAGDSRDMEWKPLVTPGLS